MAGSTPTAAAAAPVPTSRRFPSTATASESHKISKKSQ
ncbi:hypothetical protein Ae331Ps2_6257c [Pseudonocardia sp. Ae331_Ps2]|nr:hypothetical protein Ae331Ps2_6257c [Pseudonocardia sp. Ae331_Ps2]